MQDMELDRRQVLAAGAAGLVACRAPRPSGRDEPSRLDELLVAHADLLPERAGAGANHYPMAAEVLAAHGLEGEIDDAWIDGAELYMGALGRSAAIGDAAEASTALGAYDRFGDWLDFFRALLLRTPWETVVAQWAPRLAPAISAAAFHGVIRAGHAVRALRSRDTEARRDELAAGLAYWAARYVELPATTAGFDPSRTLRETLADLSHPWMGDRADVDFESVVDRLTARPIAPPVDAGLAGSASPRAALAEIVREGAAGFLEMLVLERHRIWLLHTVTGPAAVEWLLPVVDGAGAHRLVAYSRQAVVAMFAAYGEPCVAGAHVRRPGADWEAHLERAVASRSVHGIKLIDALLRFDTDDDPLWRSVAAQWFEWT